MTVLPVAHEPLRFTVSSRSRPELQHLVDLTAGCGWCGCEDFSITIMREIRDGHPHRPCQHIKAARHWHRRLLLLWFTTVTKKSLNEEESQYVARRLQQIAFEEARVVGNRLPNQRNQPSIKGGRQLGKRANTISEMKRHYLVARKQFLRDRPMCECHMVLSSMDVQCGKKSRDVHHIRGRLGSLLIDQRFWMACCRSSHNWIGDNMEQARRFGWLAPKGEYNTLPR